jgi:G3E family GTPase
MLIFCEPRRINYLGCACCSGRDDLFARLQELAISSGVTKRDRGWDRLVVECSGVAEPESIAYELKQMGLRKDPLMKHVFLAGIICLVDASTFWLNFHASGPATLPPGRRSDENKNAGTNLGNAPTQLKPLSSLLVSQLESSDTVVLNKLDLINAEELRRIQALLSRLCPNARHFATSRGELRLRSLLAAEPIGSGFDMPAYVPTLASRHSVALTAALTSAASTVKPPVKSSVIESEPSVTPCGPGCSDSNQHVSGPHAFSSRSHQHVSGPHAFSSRSHQHVSGPHAFSSRSHQHVSRDSLISGYTSHVILDVESLAPRNR